MTRIQYEAQEEERRAAQEERQRITEENQRQLEEQRREVRERIEASVSVEQHRRAQASMSGRARETARQNLEEELVHAPTEAFRHFAEVMRSTGSSVAQAGVAIQALAHAAGITVEEAQGHLQGILSARPASSVEESEPEPEEIVRTPRKFPKVRGRKIIKKKGK